MSGGDRRWLIAASQTRVSRLGSPTKGAVIGWCGIYAGAILCEPLVTHLPKNAKPRCGYNSSTRLLIEQEKIERRGHLV